MRDTILKQQLLKIADYIPESKREDTLRRALVNKIRLHQFNGEPQGVIRGIMQEFAFMLFSPWSNVPPLRTVTYFFIGMLVSFVVAFGAYTAGPGDSLYPVKLGMERIPLAMPLVPEETKLDAELKNATKRQNEIIEIIASDQSLEDKSKKIEEAGKELTRTIASSEKRVQKMSKRPRGDFGAGTASSLKVSVAKIKQTLDNAIQTESDGTGKNNKELAKALEKIYAAASVAELSSLQVMVEAPSDTVMVEEEVKEKQQENKESKEDDAEAVPVEESSGAQEQEVEKREVKQGDQPKSSAEQITDENKEEELKIAIASLRARLDQLLSEDQNDAEETENASAKKEKESDAKTTAEATFEVAEVLRLEARQERLKATKDIIERAEAALNEGDFKGAMEFIKKGDELLITLLQS